MPPEHCCESMASKAAPANKPSNRGLDPVRGPAARRGKTPHRGRACTIEARHPTSSIMSNKLYQFIGTGPRHWGTDPSMSKTDRTDFVTINV